MLPHALGPGVGEQPLDVSEKNLLAVLQSQEGVIHTGDHRRRLVNRKIRAVEHPIRTDLPNGFLQYPHALNPGPGKIDMSVLVFGDDLDSSEYVLSISAQVREDDRGLREALGQVLHFTGVGMNLNDEI